MKSDLIAVFCLPFACCLVGCASSGGGESGSTEGQPVGPDNGPADGAGESAGDSQAQNQNDQEPPEFAVRSDAFADQQLIPERYTGDGDDVSPPLAFEGVPAETVELALTVVDPDAPAGDFVHWVIFKMPATTTALSQAVPTEETLADPPGALQGENDFGDIGYGGPAPPPGETHHYVFTLYALSEPLDLEPGADRDTLLEAMDGLILTQTQITGTCNG